MFLSVVKSRLEKITENEDENENKTEKIIINTSGKPQFQPDECNLSFFPLKQYQ